MSPSKPITVKIPLPYLRLLPLTTGTAWFITLFTLLIYWLAAGRPRYPSQNNPYVAFISDIGANALKPLFITGGIITAIAFLGTIISVHLVFNRRYAHGHHGESQPRYKKVFSILAVLFQGVACPCQICLTVFDNHGHPSVHRLMLFLAFTGTALSAICTSIVFWSEMWTESLSFQSTNEDNLRRRSIIASNVIFGIEICLGVVFTVLLRLGFYRVSGIVEWVMAFLFTGYFWAFWGFLMLPGKEGGEGEGERTPLLN